jgi:hypothetical protein
MRDERTPLPNRPQNGVPRTGLRTTAWPRRLGRHSAVAVVLVVSGALAVGGCRRGEPAAAASPKAAAKAYLQAMVAGDAAGVRAASVGDEPSAQLLVAQAVKNAATERYVAAAAKRYGPAGVEAALVGRRGADHEASVLARLDAEPEAVQGDAAVVGQGRVKLFLVKAADGWKVDRQRQVPPVLGDPARYAAEAEAIRRAYDAVTAQVEAGALATPTDAKTALLIRTEAEMRPLMAAETPATTRPTTRPAS